MKVTKDAAQKEVREWILHSLGFAPNALQKMAQQEGIAGASTCPSGPTRPTRKASIQARADVALLGDDRILHDAR